MTTRDDRMSQREQSMRDRQFARTMANAFEAARAAAESEEWTWEQAFKAAQCAWHNAEMERTGRTQSAEQE